MLKKNNSSKFIFQRVVGGFDQLIITFIFSLLVRNMLNFSFLIEIVQVHLQLQFIKNVGLNV